MHGQVLIQVGLLSKTLVAARLQALERPLAGVDPQVIEKVMPLPEEHVALFVVTLQNLYVPLRPWVFVLVNSELARRRNVFVDFYRAEVEVLAQLHEDLGAVRNFAPDLRVVNVVLADFYLS